MDVGPPPKLALFLSLTLMNLVAIGICIYAPSPKNEGRSSSFNGKEKVRHVSIKKRVESSLNDEVVAEKEGPSSEDNVEDELKTLEEISQPPVVEDSELVVMNDPQPDVLEKNENDGPSSEDNEDNKNNLNVITINKNFDNDSSNEESDPCLNDICGRGAEMRYSPQDLGKSVTAVLTKSFQLIDTFNTAVIPAVENFNEQVAKTARFEKSMDSSVVGVINTKICPAVIRVSDSINRMNEKINRVTENINRANEPKERSVSCQVSETFLLKSVRKKSSFFSPISPRCEDQIKNLFGHISCKVMSNHRNRPYFKTSTVQYWANRKRALLRKFRKMRSKENLQNKTSEGTTVHENSTIESCSTFSDVEQQLRNFQRASSKDIVVKEKVTEEPQLLGNSCHDVEKKDSEVSTGANRDEGKINLSKECEPGEEELVVGSSSHFSESERIPSLPSHLPSYLTSSEEFCVQQSAMNVEDSSKTFQDPLLSNLGETHERGEYSGSESDNRASSGFTVITRTNSQTTSYVTASEILNELDIPEVDQGQIVVAKTTSVSDVQRNKSLQLTSTVHNTVERIRGPMKSRRGLQDVLDMLDPNLERNTVDTLFLLILKIFDAWSESQLSVVPSRALSRISPSESTCPNSLSMRSKSIELLEDNIESSNELISSPASYYSCTDTLNAEKVKKVCDAPNTFTERKGTVREVLEGVFEEVLFRTAEYTEIEVSQSCQFQSEYNSHITDSSEPHTKAMFKEQYSIARKIAAECLEAALSTYDHDNGYFHPIGIKFTENSESKNMSSKIGEKLETADTLVALRASSEESFHSWTPETSGDDCSYYECNESLVSRETSEKCIKEDDIDKHNLSGQNLTREHEKCLASCQDVKDLQGSEAQCSTGYYVSRPGSAVVLKASSIESWMLNSTSGDGVEIRNSHSELKSEEMSDMSSRPISDVESSHSLAEITASESSKDVQIRIKRSSRLFSKLKKKRPKTPKTSIAGVDGPSHAQSDCAMKVTESFINRNASLSDEN